MVKTGNISILEGNTFIVSDANGDIDATPTDTQGLFSADTRFLSRWLLTLDGQRLNALSTDETEYYSAQFFLAPGTGTTYVDSDISVMRRRSIHEGFHEDVRVVNHSSDPVRVDVRVEAASDFADIFEIKDQLAKKGERFYRVEPDQLSFGYRRETYQRETRIASSQPAQIDERGLSFPIELASQESWEVCLDVFTLNNVIERPVASDGSGTRHGLRTRGREGLDAWLGNTPTLVSDWRPLHQIYERSMEDLAALRFFPLMLEGTALPAAGLPWFMTSFGRDSIITSYQALPFFPELARSTLRYLAAIQGIREDPFRDEEPGKIMHELRMGEMTAFEERPHSPYFGSVDSTPLFLILLDETERWTGDTDLVRDLEPAAREAIRWIDEFGDRNHDGYIEYSRRMETGLENQCWKDSWNSILFADGSMSKLPRATCEAQGYVYDAKMRTARLAREIWGDPQLADRLEADAEQLKQRFNRDYWLEDRQAFALAIDGDGRLVDSVTSNIGHLLWSGIVDEQKAEACVRHLYGEALFSGWGVRTMATTEGGYNPIGYHLGTVWPHDNSIIAIGLRRYGYDEEAARICAAVLEAATYFRGRLPEAFAGYPRELTDYPVEYPTACSPQAWASGAPLLMLRAMLGLVPLGNRLVVVPAVPKEFGNVGLIDIPGRWGQADAFGRGRF